MHYLLKIVSRIFKKGEKNKGWLISVKLGPSWSWEFVLFALQILSRGLKGIITRANWPHLGKCLGTITEPRTSNYFPFNIWATKLFFIQVRLEWTSRSFSPNSKIYLYSKHRGPRAARISKAKRNWSLLSPPGGVSLLRKQTVGAERWQNLESIQWMWIWVCHLLLARACDLIHIIPDLS